MEVYIGIIGALITIGVAVSPSIYKRFLKHARIDIRLKYDSRGKKVLRPSEKNPRDKAVSPPDMIYDYELYWNFYLEFINNSDYPAYKLVLNKPTTGSFFQVIDSFDELKPIKPNGKFSLVAIIKKNDTVRGGNSNDLIKEKYPTELNSYHFVLKYENQAGKRFYYKCSLTQSQIVNSTLKYKKPRKIN